MTDIKAGDSYVIDIYPVNLALVGKFIRQEVIVKEYIPQMKLFSTVFGASIETEMSLAQQDSFRFATKCLNGCDLYPSEYERVITSITRTHLKEVHGIKIT